MQTALGELMNTGNAGDEGSLTQLTLEQAYLRGGEPDPERIRGVTARGRAMLGFYDR